MSLLEHVPWWGKMAAKIVLSRLGIPQSAYRRLGLFRHGPMDSPAYVRGVFESHVARAGLVGSLQGKTLLEIGPGEGVGTAMMAYAHGARAVLIDSGSHATENMGPYQALAASLAQDGLAVPPIKWDGGLEGLLEACGARYLTKGMDSWDKLPDSSMDLIFSQAVLEHIRLHEFGPLLRACRRVLKPDGICSHRVDLGDHLGGGLNNLRFSAKTWESGLFANSGFYTNRICHGQMLRLFAEAGFRARVTDVRYWGALPINRQDLAPEFKEIPEEELCISGFDVILSKN